MRPILAIITAVTELNNFRWTIWTSITQSLFTFQNTCSDRRPSSWWWYAGGGCEGLLSIILASAISMCHHCHSVLICFCQRNGLCLLAEHLPHHHHSKGVILSLPWIFVFPHVLITAAAATTVTRGFLITRFKACCIYSNTSPGSFLPLCSCPAVSTWPWPVCPYRELKNKGWVDPSHCFYTQVLSMKPRL